MSKLELIGAFRNLDPLSVLEVAVFGFAIAQMLMIILTIRRERDVNDLRALLEEQRLRLIELRAWVAGRNSQPAPITSESKPDIEPAANLKASELVMPLQKAPSAADHPARAKKAHEWQQDITARLRSGLAVQQDKKPVSDKFKWFKDDPNKPHELVEARRSLNGKPHNLPELHPPEALTMQPAAQQLEVEKALQAIRILKEEAEGISNDSSGKTKDDRNR